MNDELPQFRPVDPATAQMYCERVFVHGAESSLHALESYPDHHFRALFRLSYFTLAEGAQEPSKSQWNTLKKKMRRVNPGVFVFKAHGTQAAEDGWLGWVEFGFFAQGR
ncbi:MAG: hypothetical protein HC915_08505 [Anaerolineae bacterium]|nr:hypothetical protein [Anaerolineae bacterium]